MNKEEALKLIRAGSMKIWNKYREDNPDWKPDLSYLDLSKYVCRFWDGKEYPDFDFSGANLCGTKLSRYVSNMPKRIKNAIFNADTVFPSGFDPLEHGAVFVPEAQLKRTGFGPTPTVFISYAWANDDVVLAIDQWLRNKGIKKDR